MSKLIQFETSDKGDLGFKSNQGQISSTAIRHSKPIILKTKGEMWLMYVSCSDLKMLRISKSTLNLAGK